MFFKKKEERAERIEKKKERKQKKRSYKRDIIEIVLAVIAAWVLYQGLAFGLGTPLPIVSVVSNSMEPVLHRGDLLIVAKSDYQIGDIVIYNRPDTQFTIVHRIIKETDGGFVIKGDNNPVPDPGFVQENQILGKVQFAIPLLGYPRLALYAIGV